MKEISSPRMKQSHGYDHNIANVPFILLCLSSLTAMTWSMLLIICSVSFSSRVKLGDINIEILACYVVHRTKHFLSEISTPKK